MRTYFITGLIMLSSIFVPAQSPQAFKYQAIVRNSSGLILANQNAGFKISLVQDSATGSVVYSEEHVATTNSYGLVNLEIGSGSNPISVFADINWAAGPYFIKIEFDETGGTNYINMGTTQLLSVPYALFAASGNQGPAGTTGATGPQGEIGLTGVTGATGIQGPIGLTGITGATGADGALTAWSLTGSNGTIAGTNFIGTTDANDFVFKTNNTERMRITSAGNIGIGTTNPVTALHINGTLSITDDNEGSGKIFTSDANGVGSWKYPVIGFSSGTQNYLAKFSNDSALSNSLLYENGSYLGLGTTSPFGRFVIMGDSISSDSVPLFEVKDKTGSTVFVVWPEGVHVYVSNATGMAKTNNRGSFAVSGKSDAKANGIIDYFNIQPDSSAQIIFPSEARIIWYPNKEAFLTGRVLIEHPDSIGTNSMATGFESKAKGNWSQAFGFQAIARGDYSTAIGKNAIANATTSFAFGVNPKALGPSSYAFGAGAVAVGIGSYAIGSQGRDTLGNPVGGFTIAEGDYSMAFGQGSHADNIGAMTFGISNLANGKNSQAFGYNTTASGTYSTAMGNTTNAIGYSSTAIGTSTNANGSYSTAMGRLTTASGFASIAAGYGSNASGSSIAMGYYCTASADYALAIGYTNVASGTNSVALGQQTTASNSASTAMGYITQASGTASTAMGWQSSAIGFSSTAMGWQTSANSHSCTAMGYNTTASGYASTSAGYGTKAKSYISFVTGRYNDTTSISSSTWNAADPLFIVGNGSADNNRSNAVKVLKNGETYLPSVYNSTVGITNRDLYIDNTGKLGYISSAVRYKDNITDMENTDWVYLLRPVNYTYKADIYKHKEYGLIAEEVEKINPFFVSYNDDGIIETVSYSKLVTPLLKVIQDHKKIMTDLEYRLNEQSEKINFLLKENKELKIKNSEIIKLKAEIESINAVLGIAKNNLF